MRRNRVEHVSQHAQKRSKERLGLPKKSVERMADIAWKDGIKYDECNGKLRRWVDDKRKRDERHAAIRIYGEHIYIFRQGVFVTVFRLPNIFRKAVKKIKESKKCLKNSHLK